MAAGTWVVIRPHNCELPLQRPGILGRSQVAGGGREAKRQRTARAVSELTSVALAEQLAEWQVAVGTIAGITPFVVAGIEFSKRIATQRNCTVCGGSGLVKRDEYYFRCYSCGGFLPWQSWRRFFTGK